MKQITIYLEDADGQTDRPTGMHVDHGDGTATWLAGGALDGLVPTGSPRDVREILARLRDDVAGLDARGETVRLRPKAEPSAPSRDAIEGGETEEVVR
jgi:hypothetical protein